MEVGYERRGCERFMVSPFAGTLLRIALLREIDGRPVREGRGRLSNPSVANSTFSGKPFTSDPPELTPDHRLRWLPRTIRCRLGMPGVGRAIRQGDLAGAKALLACSTSCENTRFTRGRPPPRRLGDLPFARTTITGQWAWRNTLSETLAAKVRLILPRPRLPTTTRPTSNSSANPTISSATPPILRWASSTIPPATFTRQVSFRSVSRAFSSIIS